LTFCYVTVLVDFVMSQYWLTFWYVTVLVDFLV
jgi:hypothetical protein